MMACMTSLTHKVDTSIMKLQGMRQIFRITEFRDNCVYNTKPIGFAWVDFEIQPHDSGPNNTIFASVSIRVSSHTKTIRKVSDDTPSVCYFNMTEEV